MFGEPSFRERTDKCQPLCIPTGYQFLSILPHYIKVDMSIKIGRKDFKLNRANQKRDGDDATLYERSPSGGSPLSYVGKDYLW